jgi:hypothetical protein
MGEEVTSDTKVGHGGKEGRPKAMRDKSLDIFLMVLIGMPGIAILVVACTRPMLITEMILAISIGLAGLFWVFTRALLLKTMPAETGTEKVPARTKTKTGHISTS